MIVALFTGCMLAAVLWLIAVIHLYWGLGGVWPAADEAALARAVIGTPKVAAMPGLVPCALVALLLLAAGCWPLAVLGLFTPPLLSSGMVAAAGYLLALVFLARGVAAYVPTFRALAPEQPFARYDRRFYAPLCLLLGAGFLVLLNPGAL